MSNKGFPRHLNLTHANLEKDVSINPQLLFGWYWSDSHKATILISTNGGAIPVSETKEKVDQLMKGDI
jgi:hypothetical protein